jgi:hypothetical protein
MTVETTYSTPQNQGVNTLTNYDNPEEYQLGNYIRENPIEEIDRLSISIPAKELITDRDLKKFGDLLNTKVLSWRSYGKRNNSNV